MNPIEQVRKALEEMEIPFEKLDHPAAVTTEEADAAIEGLPGVRTKTLFLTNKKKTEVFMVIMDEDKRMDMKMLAELVGQKQIKFGSPELLKEKLGLAPGIVSLFGLLNNADRDIKVYLDKEMLAEEKVTFFANTNTQTVFLKMDDMYRFIKACGYDYEIIDL